MAIKAGLRRAHSGHSQCAVNNPGDEEDPNADTQTHANANTGIFANSHTDTGIYANTHANAETDTHTNTETETETDTDTDTDTEANAFADAHTYPDDSGKYTNSVTTGHTTAACHSGATTRRPGSERPGSERAGCHARANSDARADPIGNPDRHVLDVAS